MKKKKLKIILKNLRKIIKPHQLIFIIVLLIGNTFAWFVYSSKVSNGIDVHVRSWRVLFHSDESTITDYYDVSIPNVYPGMENFINTLTIENDSEVAANITYQILEARIFDEDYITVEGRMDNNETVMDDDLTSEELENKLLNDYPFSIYFSLSSQTLSEVVDNQISKSYYSVNLQWPFESGDDDADTYWGVKSYEFANNPLSPDSEIMLKIKIFVNQSN